MSAAEPPNEAAIDPGITLGVESASRWARFTAVALGLNAVFSGVGLLTGILEAGAYTGGPPGLTADDAYMTAKYFAVAFAWLGNLGFFALIICAVVFVKWTRKIFTVAPRLLPPKSKELRDFPASRVATSFFIPVTNLVRPYHAFAALGEALDPADLMVPRVRANAGEAQGGYRDAAAAAIPERIPVPRPQVGLWWFFWLAHVPVSWVARLFASDSLVESALLDPVLLNLIDVLAAFFAIRLVLRLDAQMRERYRRLAHATELL